MKNQNIPERFPNSSFLGSWQNGEIRLNEKDVDKWLENPICLKYPCLSEDIDYVGDNQTYSVEVYQCQKCKGVNLLGYETNEDEETEYTVGCVGIEEDLEDAR